MINVHKIISIKFAHLIISFLCKISHLRNKNVLNEKINIVN